MRIFKRKSKNEIEEAIDIPSEELKEELLDTQIEKYCVGASITTTIFQQCAKATKLEPELLLKCVQKADNLKVEEIIEAYKDPNKSSINKLSNETIEKNEKVRAKLKTTLEDICKDEMKKLSNEEVKYTKDPIKEMKEANKELEHKTEGDILRYNILNVNTTMGYYKSELEKYRIRVNEGLMPSRDWVELMNITQNIVEALYENNNDALKKYLQEYHNIINKGKTEHDDENLKEDIGKDKGNTEQSDNKEINDDENSKNDSEPKNTTGKDKGNYGKSNNDENSQIEKEYENLKRNSGIKNRINEVKRKREKRNNEAAKISGKETVDENSKSNTKEENEKEK